MHWGLLTYDAPSPEVTAPAAKAGAPGIRVHRARSLDARDTTTHRGIAITTLAKTFLDLAASSPENHLEHAIGQAMRNHIYDHRAITDVLSRHHGRRGTKALRQATVDPAFTRGDIERRFRSLYPVRSGSGGERRRCVTPAGRAQSAWFRQRLPLHESPW